MTQTTLEQIFIKLAKEQIESAETEKDVGADTSYKLKDKSLFSPCEQRSVKNELQNILPFWFRDQGRDWGRGFLPKIKSFNLYEVPVPTSFSVSALSICSLASLMKICSSVVSHIAI